MYVIGRPINGITINGKEYVLNDDGTEMTFLSKRAAIGFLMSHGLTHEDIDNMGIVVEHKQGML